MTDCLLIGFNDSNFDEWVEMVHSMGPQSGAFRDLDLTFIELGGRRLRSMDVLNHFHFADQGGAPGAYHNADFLWPAILYLGTYLAHRGFSFDYVNLFHLEKEKLRQKLLAGDVLTVAITTTLYVAAPPVLEVISFVREHAPGVRIIVGGPYIQNQTAMMDDESLQQLFHYLGADFYVISQEGEATLTHLLAALKGGGSLDAVDNLAYLNGKRYEVTARSPESNPLAENAVDYRLFPRQEIGEFISLRTAKSCPFSCSFCGFPQRAGKYTYVDVEEVERELDTLAELGVTTLTFLDDTFNVPKKRFQEILQLMIRRRYGFHWNSFYRSDHGDAETIELMARAGCEGVFLGVESGSDEMLARMNKTSRRRNYKEAIPLLQGAGISCHTNLIIGFPGETLESVEESISLVEETRPDFFRAQLWYADPVTPIWKRREEFGVQGEAFNWSHNTMDYQMACDLVDRMFLTVQGSTWLPQYGFEQWSTFYLQRKGMSLDRIKTFVRSFNAAVKEKLIHPQRREVSPEVLATLAASCHFDRPEKPDPGPVELLSGAGYLAAERYWGAELSGELPPSALAFEPGLPSPAPQRGPWGRVALPLGSEVLAALSASGAGAPSPAIALLTAFVALLSRLAGQEETVLLAAFAEGEIMPLRVRTSWETGFAALALAVGAKVRQGLTHARYALAVATNPWRRRRYGGQLPPLDVAFCQCRGGGRSGIEQQVAGTFRLWPELERELSLVLAVGEAGPGIPEAALLYAPQRLSGESAQTLARHLASLLGDGLLDPEAPVASLASARPSLAHRPEVLADAREEFTF